MSPTRMVNLHNRVATVLSVATTITMIDEVMQTLLEQASIRRTAAIGAMTM